MNYLGKDMIEAEILPRLPVKSLSKFKCVSKSWYSLISSSDFVKSHLKKSTDEGIIASYTTRDYKTRFLRTSIRSWLDEPSTFDVNDFTLMNNGIEEPQTISRFFGTCNGLCLCSIIKSPGIDGLWPDDRHEYVFWNPATNKSFKLPDLGNNYEEPAGFGFVEATNDYKVLMMSEVTESLASLYSSRTNSWKKVKIYNDRYRYCVYQSATFFNGKLHFPRIGEAVWNCISYFDLEREEHGLLELPESMCPPQQDLVSVGIFEGCISCVYNRESISDHRVWVMRQYGLKESWELVLSISYCCCSYVPIWRAHGGEVLLFHRKDGFMIYDPKSESQRNFALALDGSISMELPENLFFLEDSAYTYVESLVSPVPE